MKILVTGASGFVGTHLAAELRQAGHSLVLCGLGSNVEVQMDILDAARVESILSREQPDAVIHLAGIAHLVQAAEGRAKVAAINCVGTHHVCSALARLPGHKTLLFVSSAQVYGDAEAATAFSETSVVAPVAVYAHSKLAAEHIAQIYAGPEFAVYIARPFNHIGPGQAESFLCPSLARRIMTTANGGTIRVGNLGLSRDFSDVRDIVRAYRLIVEKRPNERLFVLGRGEATPLQEVFAELLRLSGKDLKTEVDPSLLRQHDAATLVVNPALARRVLGWACEIPLAKTLRDLYDSLQPGLSETREAAHGL